jgi:predicted secreted hydrolase
MTRLPLLIRMLLPLAVIAPLPAHAQTWQPALPGYHYQFPQDHFAHPDYQTEWWYYTGNLHTADGRRFGFELTFFRQGVSRAAVASPWALQDIYMAHLALSDMQDAQFHATERINRAGPGLAGIDPSTGRIWNGNWQTVLSPTSHHLSAVGPNFALDLQLAPDTPPILHGRNGISQKADGVGHASHYISFPRMTTSGSITLDGKQFNVDGLAWMDHEFFSESMASGETGWDWLSLQLDDHSELMLYRLRHQDGTVDPYSSGTFIDTRGQSRFLSLSDFTMTPVGDTWTSPKTTATYPVAWRVTVPSLAFDLRIETPLRSQELASRVGPSYWEGAIDIAGTKSSTPIHGVGYLEMTGYASSGKDQKH